MRKLAILAVLGAIFTPALALDDLPVYLDAGCPAGAITGGLNNGYARGPEGAMTIGKKSNGDPTVPVTCMDKLNGTDAIVIKLGRALVSGESWDLTPKFADDLAWSLKGYKEIHLFVKNNSPKATKFRVGLDLAGKYSNKAVTLEIPGGGSWMEHVVPISAFDGDSAYGVKLLNAADTNYRLDSSVTTLDLLVDSVFITDGTGEGGLRIPSAVHHPAPEGLGDKFMVGLLDNRAWADSSKDFLAGLAYRYQYVMPNIRTEYSPSGKGYVFDYIKQSERLGIKTAIVWYNLGKDGEQWGPVTKNLASSAYMKDYVDRYEYVLDQMAEAGQSDYILVLEPDMYGFLMWGPDGAGGSVVTDPAIIPVEMSRANQLAGKTYAPNFAGFAKFLVARAREKLTKGVIVGHMPNHWGGIIPGEVGWGRKEAHILSGLRCAKFLNGLGADGLGDIVFVEKADHDAGHKQPANSWNNGESWVWDSTRHANYFLWTRTIAAKTGLPICGWQVSQGNMGNKPEWRDNMAETFLAHPDWWVDGGFVGVLFGGGNPECVNYKVIQDGGWFVDHMADYAKNPYPLPASTSVAPQGQKLTKTEFAISKVREGIAFSGFAGTGVVTIGQANGRVLLTRSITAGSSIPSDLLPKGPYYVRVSTSAGSKSFALLPD